MFYMAEAVLLTKDRSFSKHSGVISAFGQYFVKSEIFDKKYKKMLSEAFEIRNIGDYGFSRRISKEESEKIFRQDVQDNADMEIVLPGCLLGQGARPS
jgi:uncharacterized protein (UPF0332 family)